MINSVNAIIEDTEIDSCPTYVHEEVCVQGTVNIIPKITVGAVQSYCVGDPIIGGCDGGIQESCSFVVGRKICMQIPLEFSAEAAVTPDGIMCGTPEVGQCTQDVACTYSMGYFKNHEELTNELITAAGGSITLGTGLGLSFQVTTANANDVLSLNTPTPPAPALTPLDNQYQNLYAQLLAAKLNVLNIVRLGGNVCDFATTAIANADSFIGSSPQGGQDGAPDVKDPLDLFNNGLVFECPQHCGDDELFVS